MNLETRLDLLVEKEPKKYSNDSVERVRKLTQYVDENPEKRISYRKCFESAEDFKIYYELHSAWQGLGRTELAKNSETTQWYTAFNNWVRAQSSDEGERNSLRNQVLPDRLQQSHSHLKSLEDWLLDYLYHDDWQGLSRTELANNSETTQWYTAFKRWVTAQSSDKSVRELLRDQVLPGSLRQDYSHLELEDWLLDYLYHDDWQGLSRTELANNSETTQWYTAFNNWVRAQSSDEGERNSLRNQVLPDRLQQSHSHLKSLEDWLLDYLYHDDWQGLGRTELAKNSETTQWYKAFMPWVRAQSSDEGERNSLRDQVLPTLKAPFAYGEGENRVYFGSQSERVVGLLLAQYGLLPKFKEGVNVHVRTNGSRKHNLDFLVDEVFFEYHPLHHSELKEKKTFETVYQERKSHITNPAYQDYDFVMIDDVEQVYDFLHRSDINRKIKPELKQLSKEKFKEQRRYAFERANLYDAEHPELFKSTEGI